MGEKQAWPGDAVFLVYSLILIVDNTSLARSDDGVGRLGHSSKRLHTGHIKYQMNISMDKIATTIGPTQIVEIFLSGLVVH